MKRIKLNKANNLKGTVIPIPGSKSESNRALIINALCEKPGIIDNLAIARDTDILQTLLQSTSSTFDARDAGTVMRFMTAYLSVAKKDTQITGTERMKKRPIGVLVKALQKIGVKISYLEKEGFPPLRILGLEEQKTNHLSIDSNVSSQFISALLMISPKLPQGLTLELTGKTVSMPYIDMTVFIMQHFGVKVDVNEHTYRVIPQPYNFRPFAVESDWSGASYWYSIFVLSDLPQLSLHGLKAKSFQGDSIIASMMKGFGVKTAFNDNGAILSKIEPSLPKELDFIECPDLAQTFAVLCAAIGHRCIFLGLQTLKIKETDRVFALRTELQKFSADFIEHDNHWEVKPIPDNMFSSVREIAINTYEDHRMAMAFAALATKFNLIIDDADVVNKSYPTFWQDLERIGFEVDFS
jgi:3-phosphoshikimate 1-carboxyvinyltransferase